MDKTIMDKPQIEAKLPKGNVKAVGNLANLKSWEKGVSGNPSGMKKGTKHKSTILREAFGAMKIQDKNKQPIDDPMLYHAMCLIEIIEDARPTNKKGEGNPAVALNALKEMVDRFVNPIEKTVRHGRTTDELALLGRQIINDIDEIEDVDYNETEEQQ